MSFKYRKSRSWPVITSFYYCFLQFARWDEHFEQEGYNIDLDTWYHCKKVESGYNEVFNSLAAYFGVKDTWLFFDEAVILRDHTAVKNG